MAHIKSLLNPTMDDTEYDSKDEVSTADSQTSSGSPKRRGGHDVASRKKPKTAKDAAVFKPGAVREPCRYPPHEDQDDFLAAQHQMHEIYPMGSIADYPRHIPYNGGKKLFWEKTGRESFEVFQYQFKIPNDPTTYTMLWDYNIGLVRTTPLFKCGRYSKTTPAKTLSRNEGLKDICHSITGGALVAQGYWIPYEAAKAVAATFCWSIRYALTPVFGTDFPNMCLHPNDENFGSMLIDPEITKRCALLAQHYRALEGRETPPPVPAMHSPQLPETPKLGPFFKRILPKPIRTTTGYTSDCTSDMGAEDHYALSSTSPHVDFSTPWSAVNSPRSPSPKVAFTDPWSPASTTRSDSPSGRSRRGRTAADIPRSHTPLDLMPPPRKPMYPTINTITSQASVADSAQLPTPITPGISPKSRRRHMDMDEDYDAGSDDSEAAGAEKSRKRSSHTFTETNAAYVLLKLAGKDNVGAGLKSLKRRASA
ncbi:hypothetical protein PV08_11417 [Exophiala spinifera]|uniref:HTH APSES-type domain-containing protein n=1 Tax=Exophiala spinifera TaxID=91928 RepID=A0A0D2AUQ1_9EURO|nr:uncharacterized protein PV08_11417 [Exophiala spinifera]KIW10453.1 hypothetical protein PV08_11417 [Exophiala spinifera]